MTIRIGLGIGSTAPSNLPFVSTWTTTTSDQVVTLPLISGQTYNMGVDWGDGNSDTITAWNQAEKAHTYSGVAATYTITITGVNGGFKFNNAGDKTVIATISQWGSMAITGTHSFAGCSNLLVTATDSPTISTTSFGATFMNCTALTSVPSLASWDTSAALNWTSFFQDCPNFDMSLTGVDTSAATNMSGMFVRCTSMTNTISVLDTSSVTNMTNMMLGCTSYNAPVMGGNFTGANVVNFAGMFNSCPAFNQPLAGLVTSSATYISNIASASPAFNQDVSSWDVSSVLGMISAFNSSSGAFDQDLGGWDIQSLTSAAGMLGSQTLSTANYDSLLTGWDANTHNNTVTFSGGTSKYTGGGAAATARANLVADGWTITDGGVA